MKLKRFGMFALAAVAVLGLASCDKKNDSGNSGTPGGEGGKDPVINTHTYNTYTTALASNWNPHTWETSADSSVLDYITTPLVNISIKDSETQEYQWVYEMATSIEDVTAAHKDDITKYASSLGKKTLDQVESGFVFEIKLNQKAAWDDGTKITADDYIDSMELLLNSSMRNYRANTYYSGTSALAGAKKYYDSEAPIYEPIVPAYGKDDEPDYSFDMTNNKVYLNLTREDMTVSTYSIKALAEYKYVSTDDFKELGDANAYGYYEVTDTNKATVLKICDDYLSAFGATVYADEEKTTANDLLKEFLFYNTGKKAEKFEFSGVGIYKVDEYTFRYVCQTYIEKNYFLSAMTSNWLVKKDVYESLYDTTGELKTTTYCTKKENSPSYGPYKIDSLQNNKQLIYTRNENWYGYERDEQGNLKKDENGQLISTTNFKVDGEYVRQYLTDKIVVDVMTDETAKQVFLKGEIDEWAPTSSELTKYTTSKQLYQVDETYTQSFFFVTNVTKLQAIDAASNDNLNTTVLSNINFRKAFSLAINRAEWVTATPGYKPAFALMNSLYYYDAFNDPTSIYRSTDEAKLAIVNLYGVEYGADKTYKTLDEAYNSINGYNLSEAKKLMKQAYEELSAAGLLNGTEIKIQIAYKKGALETDDNAQVALIQKYLNAAIEGSGFTSVTLTPLGNLEDRYGDVSEKAKYAIGYGAWGGAAFYPFSNFQVYFDSDQYDISEAQCWDPTAESFTIKIDGTDVTMTYQEWSNSMEGEGVYADADFETKLLITSKLEEKFLSFYYRIPLAGSTSCFLLSYKLSYFTEDYNIMYAFGGLRLLQYNYNDAEWAQYVKDNSVNGSLKY